MKEFIADVFQFSSSCLVTIGLGIKVRLLLKCICHFSLRLGLLDFTCGALPRLRVYQAALSVRYRCYATSIRVRVAKKTHRADLVRLYHCWRSLLVVMEVLKGPYRRGSCRGSLGVAKSHGAVAAARLGPEVE